MGGKSIDYWRQQWNNIQKSDLEIKADHTINEDNCRKVLVLLFKYLSIFSIVNIQSVYNRARSHGYLLMRIEEDLYMNSIPLLWYSYAGRFFSGHWNTHHADAVQKAINKFITINKTTTNKCYDLLSFRSFPVELILSLIKKEIGNKPIKEDGDLARIFQVIKERTGIDYFTSLGTLSKNFVEKKHKQAWMSHSI